MKPCLTLLLITVFLFGCRKKDENIRQFNFVNSLQQKVIVNIYSSEEDYIGNKNAVYSGIATANNILEIPYNVFQLQDHEYYLDWYSEDYEYSNWNDIYDEIIKPSDSGDISNYSFNGEMLFIGPARKIFLSGNGTGSKWKTTGSYDNNVKWNALSEEDRNYEIEFDKSLNARVTFKGVTSSCPIHTYGSAGEDFFMGITTKAAHIILSFDYMNYKIPVNTDSFILSDQTGQEGLIITKQ